MWLQQKLNPAPTDATQAMIFAWMPWVFMFMLGTFASGLIIYWIANNMITFAQQYMIMRSQGYKPDVFGNIKASLSEKNLNGLLIRNMALSYKITWGERVSEVRVRARETLPYDRVWAVLHENSTADGRQWVACHNFSRGAKAPGLMAIATNFDEATNILKMSYPTKNDLIFCPDTQGEKLIDWTKDLIPSDRSGSAKLIRAQAAAMTDTDYPSITICSSTSHDALAKEMGCDLSKNRWRGNLWIDNLEPWEEWNG